MSHTITIRINKDLSEWLAAEAARTGVSRGKIVHDQLERAKSGAGSRPFMRLAGAMKGAKSLSQQTGFARSSFR
jgi:hypothetical protein